ncbi:hypothetical protein BVC80_237g38 [Macleaya cordata]|uniref:Uncharacterized protein n=1 Tax=Macleaya cordata TaxID=56857 RepID=A0A200RB49_MACCD|nr:hypothetical protein BVC80_237g38 [Macleaya cordata]
MVPEPTNPKKSSHSTDQQRQLDREVREMLSTLTHRLTDLHHHSSKSDSIQVGEDEEEHGVRIITLAGSNTGATMKAAEWDEKSSFGISSSSSLDQEGMTAYANSNFQAINNSIMLGGSYSCKDPGIHMETSDYVEQHEHHNKPILKHGKKGKRKEKRDSHSTQDEISTDSDHE